MGEPNRSPAAVHESGSAVGYNPYDFLGKDEIPLGLKFTLTGRAILRSFRLPSFCVAIAILGMIPLLSAQQSRRVPPAESPISVPPGPYLHSREACRRDQCLHRSLRRDVQSGLAVLFGVENPDIGAWTNAAIALIGCGEVYIPAGTYRQTTPIVKPRCVKLGGASGYGTTLTYTTTTGCAVVIADGSGASLYAPGALEDLNLIGPGAGPPADDHQLLPAASTLEVVMGVRLAPPNPLIRPRITGTTAT